MATIEPGLRVRFRTQRTVYRNNQRRVILQEQIGKVKDILPGGVLILYGKGLYNRPIEDIEIVGVQV